MRIWTQTLHMNAITHFELLKGGFVVFEEMQPWDSLCLCPTASAAALPAAPLWILAPGRKAAFPKFNHRETWLYAKRASEADTACRNATEPQERREAQQDPAAVRWHSTAPLAGLAQPFWCFQDQQLHRAKLPGLVQFWSFFFFLAFFFKQRPAVF